ncbi:MAG: hypothetical protein COW69_00005 [Candidatus Huberarchaeum crystalense]|uniref:Uncharacterized protein n=1 Tax=Huberarchaeum crystalense TaxID=2014257 RepID=A0A2G9LJU3_HUBC1|nr:MAG: hypothetical protein COW69_00005 [Candidatus Huberarchaeum crystalense]
MRTTTAMEMQQTQPKHAQHQQATQQTIQTAMTTMHQSTQEQQKSMAMILTKTAMEKQKNVVTVFAVTMKIVRFAQKIAEIALQVVKKIMIQRKIKQIKQKTKHQLV